MAKAKIVSALADLLDMSTPARMERAAEQGYGDTLYHASRSGEFDAFDPSYGGVNTGTFDEGVNTSRSAVFFSDDKNTALEFGDRLGEYKTRGNIAEFTRDLQLDFADSIDPTGERDLWLEAKYVQQPWQLLDDSLGIRFKKWATEQGYDGIRFPEEDGVTTAIFDPANIRSVNAAFDPAKRNSADLLAGAAGAAVLGGAVAPEDAEAGPLGAGARRIIDERFLSALGGGNPRVKLKDTVEGMQTGIAERNMDFGQDLNLYDFEGSPYILTQSDRSAAGGEIVSVHGQDIDPVDLRGGRDFMFDEPSAGQVWASDPAVVKGLKKRADALKAETGEDALLLPYSMAPTGIDFATMPLDTMVGFARAKMSKANKKKLDRRIKEVIPTWGGVDDPAAVAAFREVKGPARKKIADIIDKDFREVPGGMSISEARAATSDSAQYMSPEGQILNVGRIDSSRPVIADSGHPTYIGGLPGEGVGRLKNPLDVRPFMAQNGRQLAGDASDIRALSMNHGLSQGVITEKLLRSIFGGGAAAAVLGGALSPEEADASFGGVMARNADQFMLSVANKMKEAGRPRDEIWQKTGWDLDTVDGKPRFEIDDSQMSMDPAGLGWGASEDLKRGNRSSDPIGNYVSNPEMDAAYPWVLGEGDQGEKIIGSLRPGSRGGSYGDGVITHGINTTGGLSFSPDNKSTMGHEIQHAIQEKEGFAQGGTTGAKAWLSQELRPALVQEYSSILDSMQAPLPYDEYLRQAWGGPSSPEAEASYKKYIATMKRPLTSALETDAQITAGNNVYKRLAGEVEARNVEKRLNMTPQERRQTPPWETADVPESEQIVRMRGSDSPEYVSALNEQIRQGNQASIDGMYRSAGVSPVTMAAAMFTERRAAKGSKWRELRQKAAELMNAGDELVRPIMPAVNTALAAMDLPMKGYYGITSALGELAAGGGIDSALQRGATVARQPIEQTADEYGGALADKGYPATGSALNALMQLSGPI